MRYIMTQNRTDLGKVVGANLRCLIKGSAYRTQAEFAYALLNDDRDAWNRMFEEAKRKYGKDEKED